MVEALKQKGKIFYRVDGIPYVKRFSSEEEISIPHGVLRLEEELKYSGLISRITVKTDRRTTFELEHISLTLTLPVNAVSCFANGYQSWSESCELPVSSSQKRLNPLFSPWINRFQLKQYGESHFHTPSGKQGWFTGYTYGTVRDTNNQITLAGSLSERYGYTMMTFHTLPREGVVELTVEKECEGMSFTGSRPLLEYFLGTGNEREVYAGWRKAASFSELTGKPVLGWSSWYYHYNKISEEIIRRNLREFDERGVPIDIFQIDDGWQSAVGDWLTLRDSFPTGMAGISKEIRKCGYRPGLWIAPFIAEESSVICESHADWILRDSHGPVRAGYNPFYWSGNFYALDILNAEVQDYLRLVFRTIIDHWGFEMIKADFLYAAALIPQRGKTRGEIMEEGMRLLRELCGNHLLLGCGVPLGSSFVHADYCRIGGDITPVWEDFRLKNIRFQERASTRSSLRSTIGRAPLNTLFLQNDPDVIMLRDRENSLTPRQRQTLFLANNLFGSLIFTSDDLSEYNNEQLALYYSSFPFVEKQIDTIVTEHDFTVADFHIGERCYRAYINLSGRRKKIVLPGDNGSSWYSEETGIRLGGWETVLNPYQSLCLVRVPVRPWTIIGTTGRLFPGSEVESVYREENELTVIFRENTLFAGDAVVRLPKGTEICMINNNSALIEEKFGITIGRASLI